MTDILTTVGGAYLLFTGIMVTIWIFEKGGEPAWKVFVPGYNLLVMMQIVRMSYGWLLFLIFPGMFFILLHGAIGIAFRKPWWFIVGLILAPPVFMAAIAIDGSSCNGYTEGRVRPYIDLVDEYQERGLI